MPITINTPVGRLSYPALFAPRTAAFADGGGGPKYSAALILNPDDCARLREAIMTVAREKWGDRAMEGLRTGRLKSPLRDGALRDDPAYVGKLFINASSKNRPSVVDRHGNPVTDPELIYPGMYARLNVGVFAYEHPANKGVSLGLNHVQVTEGGERLDSRRSAADAFADGEALPSFGGTPFEAEANPFD